MLCPRCGKTITKQIADSLKKTVALSLAGLLLYFPSILLPLMTFQAFGFSDSANILESILNFSANGYYFVSLMVAISAVLFPLILLLSIFIVTANLLSKRSSPNLRLLFRYYLHLEEWAMVEVYLLGIMITIFKMHGSSDIVYHSGVFCFSILVLITLAISTVIDRDLFWQCIDSQRSSVQPAGEQLEQGAKDDQLENLDGNMETAVEQGLISCHTCHLLSSQDLENSACPRCGEKLHQRKVMSISRTWALVITSAIFLVPANVLPIMKVDFLGIPDSSTILDGIIYFFQDGDYLIGLLIFTASVLVPVYKIIGLLILLLSRTPCRNEVLQKKTKMYRFIAFIGRWSMLDIFVIALLTTLVDFGFFTSIHTAPAATYFCIVVASTMFAAITFDPRIMWDKCSVKFQDRK